MLGCSKDPSILEKPVIGHGGEYQQVLAEAERLSKGPLEKLSRDEDISESEKTELVKASAQFQALIDFEPGQFAPYLALGMIYRGVGNLEKAEQMLRQCLNNIPASSDQAVKDTSAEAHYQLARVLFDAQKFELSLAEASTAVQTVSDNPNYHYARGAALGQLNLKTEAKRALRDALRLDPDHRRANGLLKLLK